MWAKAHTTSTTKIKNTMFNFFHRYRRPVAAGLLVTFLTQLLTPTVAYALTAGPTSPEATSFEPIDTTDMVNLATGDFTYSLPLLEVPGPEGGFPISMSYHADIQPNEEASWTGLGWTLNTGAITRIVNGYPDDAFETKGTRRDYWSGGTRTSFSIGVVIGPGGAAGPSFGLTFSNDTYTGFGVGAYSGYSVGLFGIAQAEGRIQTSSRGQTNANIGLNSTIGYNYGILTAKAQASVGITTNFETIKGYSNSDVLYGVSMGKLGSMDVSMNTGQVSVRAAGISVSAGQTNGNSGNVSTSTFQIGGTIPTPWGFGIQLGFNSTRYWIDETSDVKGIGTLHTGTLNTRLGSLNFYDGMKDYAFDSYDMPEFNKVTQVNEQGNAANHAGGAFAAYDSYSVQAQGVGGQIQPYILKHTHTFKQNVKKKDGDGNWFNPITYYQKPNTDKKVQFRFAGEYANNYKEQNPANISYANLLENMTYSPATMQAGGDYDAQNNQLAGTKHIEWFTNQEIREGQAANKGFIPNYDIPYPYPSKVNYVIKNSFTDSPDFFSPIESNVDKSIGGFRITNETGLVYHFGLASYSFGSYQKTEKVTDKDNTYTKIDNPDAYAHTWYLTAITGPDYVDRNNNKQADAEDWGYWTVFSYDLKATNYLWRNPANGVHKDMDTEFETYSYGYKQVYYLKSIQNRENKVAFDLIKRADGKSVTNEVKGGSDITKETRRVCISGRNDNCGTPDQPRDCFICTAYGNVDLIRLPDMSYGLNSITLFSQTGDIIRKVNFEYDYSLCPETLNSYDKNGVITSNNIGDLTNPNNPMVQNMNNKLGKLTLKSIKFCGKGGVQSLIPPIEFDYDLKEPILASGTPQYDGMLKKFVVTLSRFKAGDLVRFTNWGKTYYACLLPSDAPNKFALNFLGKNQLDIQNLTSPIEFTETKNPPYHKDFVDVWGKYKADFEGEKRDGNNISYDFAHQATKLAAQSKDVWSLRTITTSLGAKVSINYESDSYQKSVESVPIVSLSEKAKPANGIFEFAISDTDWESLDENITKVKVNLVYSDYKRYGGRFVRCGTLDGGADYECAGDWHWTCHARGLNTWLLCDYLSGKCHNYYLSHHEVEMEIENKGRNYIKLKNTAFNTQLLQPREFDISTYRLLFATPPFCAIRFEGLPSFKSGFITIDRNILRYGDGLRVQSIAVEHDSQKSTTHYDYKYPKYEAAKKDVVSGVTSYEPTYLSINLENKDGRADNQAALDKIKAALLKKQLPRVLSLSREIPPPAVIYEYVTVRQSTQEGNLAPIFLPGYSRYQFQTYQREMIEAEQTVQRQNGQINTHAYYAGRTKIKNKTSNIGKLLASYSYGADDKLLGEVRYDYADENTLRTQYKSQGIIDQSFSELKLTKEGSQQGVKSNISTLTEVPSVLLGTKAVDYTTGISTETKTLAFDFYTGQPTHTYTKDAFGNEFLSVAVPAYQVRKGAGLQYPEMGLKTTNPNNKNMLTQEGESYSYKLYPAGSTVGSLTLDVPNLGNRSANLLSAGVQTWNNQWAYRELQNGQYNLVAAVNDQNPVWRKHQSYSWRSATMNQDGTHPAFTPYDWNGQANGQGQPAGWQKNGELTLYDRYSHALEAQDVNGNFAATKMGYNQSKVLATSSGVGYNQFAYSGAEDMPVDGYFGGEVKQGTATRETNAANIHTGQYSLKVAAGQTAFVAQVKPAQKMKNYRLSVWVRDPEQVKLYFKDVATGTVKYYTGNIKDITEGKSGKWTLLNWDVEFSTLFAGFPPTEVEVGIEGQGTSTFVDDFRVHPLQAPIIAYVYDNQYGELTHLLDANNLYTAYTYDVMGRLTEVHKEVFNQYNASGRQQVSKHEYNYRTN